MCSGAQVVKFSNFQFFKAANLSALTATTPNTTMAPTATTQAPTTMAPTTATQSPTTMAPIATVTTVTIARTVTTAAPTTMELGFFGRTLAPLAKRST